MKKLLLLFCFLLSYPSVFAQSVHIQGDTVLCGQDTAFLSALGNGAWHGNPALVTIPDGTGIYNNLSVVVEGFPDGDTLSSASQIESICLDIEHSWARDLEISLVCPNNKSVILHNFAGQSGGQVFLGLPIDSDNSLMPMPGTLLEYCFNQTPDFNYTMMDYANQFSPGTLPSGSYKPFENLNKLIGCPFNGSWQLIVEDLWPIDNGFASDFSIYFGNSTNIVAPLSYLWSTGDTTPTAFTTTPGSISVILTDQSGQMHHDTVEVVNRAFSFEIASNTYFGNFCWEDTVNLQTTPDFPRLNCTWFFEDQSNLLATDSTYSTTLKGNYIARVAHNGCIAYDTISLNQYLRIEYFLDTTLVQGDTMVFLDGSQITSAGIYSNIVSSSMGCDSTIYWFVDEVSNVLEGDARSFYIMPNPANDLVFVQTPFAAAYEVEIYGSAGQKLKTVSVMDKANVSINELPLGIYWVKLSQNGRTVGIQKLFISR